MKMRGMDTKLWLTSIGLIFLVLFFTIFFSMQYFQFHYLENDIFVTKRIRPLFIIVALSGVGLSVVTAFIVIRRMKSRLVEEQELTRLQKEFLIDVSHELRTPLVMLQGYSEAILDGIATTKDTNREYAQIIHEEALRMGRLVNDLLELAQMENSEISITKEAVELSPYLTRIIEKFQVIAAEKEIELRLRMENPDAIIWVDSDRMEQVFTNLIGNAIQHSSRNSIVEITQESKARGICFHIRDFGTGISEADLPYIFERYYKADKNEKCVHKGAGLGLLIAKRIVESHAGVIHVTSQVGIETTFSVFLPLMPQTSCIYS